MPPVRVRRDVVREFVAAQNHYGTVQVEERKAGPDSALRLKPGAAEQIPQFLWSVVSAVADMFVESRHRATGDGDDDAATRRQITLHIAQQRRRLIQVFEDLGTDRLGRPAPQFAGDSRSLEKIALPEPGSWNLAARHLNTSPAQFETGDLSLGVPFGKVGCKVAQSTAYVKNSRARTVSLNSEMGKNQFAAVFLRWVLPSGLGILFPM